jgi:hypothetical protein
MGLNSVKCSQVCATCRSGLIGGVLEGRKARVLLQLLREEHGSLRIEPVVAEAATEQSRVRAHALDKWRQLNKWRQWALTLWMVGFHGTVWWDWGIRLRT